MDGDLGGTSMEQRFNLMVVTDGLIADLQALREGRISVRDARARAELARQILRSVHYVVTAQKFIAEQAKAIPAITEGVDHG